MPRRKKGQSADFVAGAYKKIAQNKEGFNAQQLREMRLAADRLALMDEILTIEQVAPDQSAQPATSATPAPPAQPIEDTLLANLRAKHGGTSATA